MPIWRQGTVTSAPWLYQGMGSTLLLAAAWCVSPTSPFDRAVERIPRATPVSLQRASLAATAAWPSSSMMPTSPPFCSTQLACCTYVTTRHLRAAAAAGACRMEQWRALWWVRLPQ